MKVLRHTPKLLFNHDGGMEDCREVVKLLEEAGVDYLSLGPTSDFPSFKKVILDYGFCRYHGIKEIKEFIERWKNNNLPTYDPKCSF